MLIQLIAHSAMLTHLTQDMERSLGTQSDDTCCFIVGPSVIFCECVQTVLFLTLTSERNMLARFLLVGCAWTKTWERNSGVCDQPVQRMPYFVFVLLGEFN